MRSGSTPKSCSRTPLNCNTGKDPCTTGKKFKLTHVPLTAADGELIRSAVTKVSLPVWAEVCDKSNPGCSKELERAGRTGAGAEMNPARPYWRRARPRRPLRHRRPA